MDLVLLIAGLATFVLLIALAFVATRPPRYRGMPAPQLEPLREPLLPQDELVDTYIGIAEAHARDLAIDAASLPAPKPYVRAALLAAISNAHDREAKERLVRYYLRLAAFQPGPFALPSASETPPDWTSLPLDELRELLITVRNDPVSDLLIRVKLEEQRLARDVV